MTEFGLVIEAGTIRKPLLFPRLDLHLRTVRLDLHLSNHQPIQSFPYISQKRPSLARFTPRTGSVSPGSRSVSPRGRSATPEGRQPQAGATPSPPAGIGAGGTPVAANTNIRAAARASSSLTPLRAARSPRQVPGQGLRRSSSPSNVSFCD